MPTPARRPLRPPHRITVVALAAVLGVAPAGCGDLSASDPPDRTVTLGVLLAEEGVSPGVDARQGAQLAVDLINGTHPDLELPLAEHAGLPGLDGATLALAVAGTGGDPAAAEAAMADLLDAGAVAVVASDRAEVVEIAGAYASRQEVPLVDGVSSAGFLLDIGLEWYFRTAPADRTLIDSLLGYLRGPSGVVGPSSPLTVLTPADGRGADVAALIADQAAAAGMKVTDPVAVGDTVTADLAARAPQVLVAVAPDPADGPALLTAIEDWLAVIAAQPAIYPAPPVVAGLGAGFAGAAGAPAGLLYASAYSPELAARQPLAAAVATRYQERFDTPMSEPAAMAFTATLTLAMALDAAGDTAAPAVRAALRQLSVPATRMIVPWTGIQFGENGQNELAAAVVTRTDEAGAEVVFPPELALA